MDRVRIDVGGGCAYRCPICVRWRGGPAFRPLESLVAELGALDPDDTGTLVLDGGEPLLHPDLPAVVAAARAHGLREVELRTNAAHPEALAAVLAASRVAAAVHLPSLDVDVAAALTGRPDGLARTAAGIDRLLAAGASVSIVTPVTRANVATLAAFVEGVATRWPAVRLVELAWYTPPSGSARDPLHVPARAAEAELRAALAAAERHRLRLRSEREWPVVPCLFAAPDALAPLFLTGGGVPVEARRGPCAACLRAPVCTGPARAQRLHAAGGAVRPILDPASPLAAAPPTRAAGFATADDALTIAMEAGPDGQPLCREVVMRLTERCNERCPFCWVHLTAADVPDERVAAQLDRIAALSPARVSVSGGEPALLPERLLTVVGTLRARTRARLVLQTNATRIDAALAGALAASGLDEAFVSLHGHTEALYDRTTGTRGLLGRALAGIDALLAAGVTVVVNHVVSAYNADALVEFVRFLATRFARRAILNLSIAHPIDPDVQRTPEVFPRFSAIRGPLRAALDEAIALGLPYLREGLGVLCGVPLCLLDADPRYVGPLPPRLDPQPDFRHGPACEGCTMRARCPGVRALYAEQHGFDELATIR